MILCEFRLDDTLMLTTILTIESSCLSHEHNETNSAVVMPSTDSMATTTGNDVQERQEDPQDTQIDDDQVIPPEFEPSETSE